MSGRIRTIKPEWTEDEHLAAASDAARVLSVVLLLLADDHGNGRAHVAYLASRAWPYGNPIETVAKAEEALRNLARLRFVELYETGGQRYFHVRNWTKHQKVQHPGTPRVPQFCELNVVPHEESGGLAGSLTPDLRSPISDHDQGPPETPATAGSEPHGSGARSEPREEPASEPAPDTAGNDPPARPDPLVLVPVEAGGSAVDRVFAAHVEGWKHTNRAGGRPPVCTDKRRKLIRAALKLYPEPDVCAAARGVFLSEFHVREGHTSIDLALRDAAHIERFRAIADRPELGRDRRGGPVPQPAQRPPLPEATPDTSARLAAKLDAIFAAEPT